MERIEHIENWIMDAVSKTYAKNVVRFSADPEAPDIISVELFDIPDSECRRAKSLLWEIIEESEDAGMCSFVPAVYSHSKTLEFYPEYCVQIKANEIGCGTDFNDLVLSEDMMKILANGVSHSSDVEAQAVALDIESETPMTAQQLLERFGNVKESCNAISYALAA